MSAALPSLDINELNFDTCERLRHLDKLLKQLGLEPGARVLDVGGYPGYMARAFPHWNIVTVDTYAKGHPPYVKASGAALPFADATFDATIACDVLEHVPPQFREAFLRELVRVSSSAVIVAGPYDTPGAARAELLVRELLPASSPAQGWLAEHAQCGLPSMADTRRVLGATAAGTGVVPTGSLTAWILFFAAQAAGESDHQIGDSAKRFIKDYNAVHETGGGDNMAGGGPAYRHAIIAAINAPTALRLTEIDRGPVEPEHTTKNGSAIEDYVESLGTLLKQSFNRRSESGEASSSVPGRSMDAATAEYISRLEKMLVDRSLQIPHGDQAGDRSNLGSRIARAWRTLMGN